MLHLANVSYVGEQAHQGWPVKRLPWVQFSFSRGPAFKHPSFIAYRLQRFDNRAITEKDGKDIPYELGFSFVYNQTPGVRIKIVAKDRVPPQIF